MLVTCTYISGIKFVGLYEGTSGTIGNIEIYGSLQFESVSIPIDTLVLGVARNSDFYNDVGRSISI